MLKNWTFLSIETTGLNHKNDEIYLVNLLKSGEYIPLWIEEKEDLPEKLKNYLGDSLFTFSGRRFEEPFLKAKKVKIESFDLYDFLKGWFDFDKSLKLSDLAKEYSLKEPVTFRKRQKYFKDYKESSKKYLKEKIEEQGKIGVELRYKLWKEILKEIKERSFSLDFAPESFVFFYNYKIEKDFLIIKFCSLEKLPEIFMQQEYLMKNEENSLIIEFPIQRGVFQGEEISCISYSKLEPDYSPHFYQIENEGVILEEKIKTLIEEIIKEIKKK